MRELATLQPELVVTGHGQAFQGEEMREGLNTLATNFDEIAVPGEGTYGDNG